MKKIFNAFLLICVLLLTSTVVLAETVMYNTKSNIYHKPSCQWAKKCTVNCIKIEKKDAIRRGGRPCKVCGG